jgi:hypothetical protein
VSSSLRGDEATLGSSRIARRVNRVGIWVVASITFGSASSDSPSSISRRKD